MGSALDERLDVGTKNLLHAGGSARMVFGDLRLDPILHSLNGRLSLHGFHVRPYNEKLLLDMIPGNLLETSDWISFCQGPQSTLIPGWNRSIATRCLILREDGPLSHQIFIPTDHHDQLPASFFWCVDAKETPTGLSRRLCLLDEAQPFVNTRNKIFSLDAAPAEFVLSESTAVAFDFVSQSGHYKVGFHILSVVGTNPTMKVSFEPQVVTLSLHSTGAVKLTMLVDIYLIEPLIAQQQTSIIRRGTLAFVFDDKVPIDFGMRIMCCLTSRSDRPLGEVLKYRPEYHQLQYSLFDGERQAWQVDKEHAEWFAHNGAIVLVGDIQPSICAAFFHELGIAAKVMGIITTQPSLRQTLSANTAFQFTQDNSFLFSYGNREIAILELPAFSVDDKRVEDFLIYLLERHQELYELPAHSYWHDALAKRLPPLPICDQDRLDAISVMLLGNTQRGRVPPNSTMMARDVFQDASFWLFPVNAQIETYEELIVELVVRLASEYLGARCFCELFGGLFRLVRPARPNELRECDDVGEIIGRSNGEIFEELFSNWQNGVDAWTAPASIARIHEALSDRGLESQDMLKGLAIAAHRGFASEASEKTWKLSHLNPLVIALLPTEGSGYDARLHAEAELDETVRKLQATLRSLFHEPPTDEILDEILSLRILLGSCGQFFVESVFAVLNRLGADRILTFSNIPLDFVPYRGSILGLEVSLSRYPVSMTAYQFLMTAHNANRRLGALTQRRAAILCPPLGNSGDSVIRWANEIGETVGALAHISGLEPFYPIAGASDGSEVLAGVSESRLVLFAGHGFAVDGWAGLNLDKFYLEYSDVMAQSWAGSLVLLFACESGAVDASRGDLSRAFLLRGARGVIATTAKVRLDVADFLLRDLLIATFRHGLTIDHAFARARRRAALFEYFNDPLNAGLNSNLPEALDLVDKVPAFSLVLKHYSIELNAFIRATRYALSFTLLGGVGERIA
jgi:hypothetical protein